MEKGIIIQIGQIYLNRTKKYLLPTIKHYGADYVNNITSLYKLAVGIGDVVCSKCGQENHRHIFILIDTNVTKGFIQLLDWFQRHHSYENDYPFGTIHKGHFHMLVIRVPEAYLESVNHFKESNYSDMFNLNQVNILFNPPHKYQDTRDVLLRDTNYRLKFIELVSKEFDVPIKDIILSPNQELDFPINEFQEIFNKHLE